MLNSRPPRECDVREDRETEVRRELWERYEREKQQLQMMDLSVEAYEAAIRAVAARLGL